MRTIRKLYRVTPINREIEQKERILHILKVGSYSMSDLRADLPYREVNELEAYVAGLKKARELMKMPTHTYPPSVLPSKTRPIKKKKK